MVIMLGYFHGNCKWMASHTNQKPTPSYFIKNIVLFHTIYIQIQIMIHTMINELTGATTRRTPMTDHMQQCWRRFSRPHFDQTNQFDRRIKLIGLIKTGPGKHDISPINLLHFQLCGMRQSRWWKPILNYSKNILQISFIHNQVIYCSINW